MRILSSRTGVTHRARQAADPHMSPWAGVTLAVAAALGCALWVARGYLARSVRADTAALKERARQQPLQRPGVPEFERLPAPVRRYLNRVLPADRRRLSLVRYNQRGVLRTDPTRDRWMAFTASQVISPMSAGFQWVARVSFAPGIHLQVRDTFIDGRGFGQVALLSTIPIASAGGNPEMNAGALHRFLAEAVWYPSALFPSPVLSWSAIDQFRAEATLTSGSTTVSLELRFNDDDEVTGIYTPARWGAFNGGYKQVAWEGRFRNYARQNGVLVPGEGEVGWYIDGQWQPVWRGTVFDVAMEFQ